MLAALAASVGLPVWGAGALIFLGSALVSGGLVALLIPLASRLLRRPDRP